MSIIEQIKSSKSQGDLLQLIEEHVIDVEITQSWGEEAEILEREGQKDKAEMLRAAEKRWFELEQE